MIKSSYTQGLESIFLWTRVEMIADSQNQGGSSYSTSSDLPQNSLKTSLIKDREGRISLVAKEKKDSRNMEVRKVF